MPLHPALGPGRVAVVTGAASGIGLAAAAKFAGLGMKVVMADANAAALEAAEERVSRLAAHPATCASASPTSATSRTSSA